MERVVVSQLARSNLQILHLKTSRPIDEVGVEMGESLGNFDLAYGLDPFRGQIRGRADAPVAALQAFPFLNRRDHEGVSSMFGDDDRFVPGFVAEHAKGVLELA